LDIRADDISILSLEGIIFVSASYQIKADVENETIKKHTEAIISE